MDESPSKPEETGADPSDMSNAVPEGAADPAAGDTSSAVPEGAADPAAGDTSSAVPEGAADPAAGDTSSAVPEGAADPAAGDTSSAVPEGAADPAAGDTPDATSDDAEPGQDKAEETHDVIYVGGKPIMTYVNATLTLIKSTPVVTLMARGHRIKQAVDVALTIVKRMSAVGYTIGDVRISSNPMESLDGKSRNISTIEIDIQKSDS